MKTISKQQGRIIQSLDDSAELSHWRDWRWQMRHCVNKLDTFEALLDVQLNERMREDFAQTVKKFPMSVTGGPIPGVIRSVGFVTESGKGAKEIWVG